MDRKNIFQLKTVNNWLIYRKYEVLMEEYVKAGMLVGRNPRTYMKLGHCLYKVSIIHVLNELSPVGSFNQQIA